MSSREWVMDQILLVLDRRSCHGYELRRLLAPIIGDLELTTLYRWLHAMEAEGLVDSEMQTGPHGPPRRVYRVGMRGEGRLRRILRDAIRVVLHFYDAYRHFALREQFPPQPQVEANVASGLVLISAISQFLVRDVELIQFLARRAGNDPLYVLGDPSMWDELELTFARIEGAPWDIACRNDQFAEIWLLGIPPRTQVPRTVVEGKRVLQPGGVLRIIAPFVFFGTPPEPTLETFLRVTAVHLFPELNVVDGQEIRTVFERHFDQINVIQFFPGYVEFSGIK